MKRLFVAAVIAAVMAFAHGQAFAAQTTLIDRVVAVVGDDVVTLSELQTEMAQPLAEINKRYRGDDLARETDKLKRLSLNMLIDKKLQLHEARVQGMTIGKEELDNAVEDVMRRNNMDEAQFEAALMNEGYTVQGYRATLEEQLLIIRLVSAAVRSKVVIEEPEVTGYYEANKDSYSEKQSIRIANISFPAKDGDKAAALDAANKARQEIMDGTPFEDMAVKCTGDPKAAKSCELGTFSPGELSESMNDMVFAMKEGDVSQPIEMPGGYQLIKVMAKSEDSVRPLEEVRGEIVEELGVRKAESIFAKWIQELRSRTYVEIRD